MARILTALLFCVSLAMADAPGVAEAEAKRDAAAKDWEAGNFAAAAAKLRVAAKIYEGLEGDHRAGWAVSIRALVWNQRKLNDKDGALASFKRLAAGLEGRDDLVGELASARRAMYELETAEGTLLGAVEIAHACAEVLVAHGFERLAAQVLHDAASHTASRGDVAEGIKLYLAAAKARQMLADHLGVCWSFNNIAYYQLRDERPEEAVVPLLLAYRVMHEYKLPGPQGSVAINLRQLLTALPAELGKYEEHLVEAAISAAASEMPHTVSMTRLTRPLLERGTWTSVRKVALLKQTAMPDEVSADLRIRAARRAVALGKHEDALRWLDKAKPGSGPAGAHLTARIETTRALAHAAAAKNKEFLATARKAVAAWGKLGDFAGNKAALQDLATAVKALGLGDNDITAAWEAASRAGGPGGSGGSAQSGGDRGGYGRLGLHDTLFVFKLKDGNIHVEDTVTGKTLTVKAEWSPRIIGLNGVSMMFFGGYVVVQSAAYGGAAVGKGAPGQITLDALGDYWPVPGQGTLVLTKNGAMAYR